MLRDGLKEIDGVLLYGQDDLTDHIAVLSFNIAGMEALNTGTLLDGEYDIACRTGLHCAPLVHEQLGTDRIGGTVRIGIGPFNTEAHIKTLLQAVAELVAFQNRK
jgi:selenocysteine lyase/cysteine desulfurase